jgi:hypothetical protein
VQKEKYHGRWLDGLSQSKLAHSASKATSKLSQVKLLIEDYKYKYLTVY